MAHPKPVANWVKLAFVVAFFALLHLREGTRDDYVAAAPEQRDTLHTDEITMGSRTVYLTPDQSARLENLRTAAWCVLVVGVVFTLFQDRRL